MMIRDTLLVLCLLIPGSLLPAQEPAAEAKQQEPAPATEKPKPPALLETYSPVLPLTALFDEPDAKPVVVSGTYLNQDGLVLTVLPSSKPVKDFHPDFDRMDLVGPDRPLDISLLARDPLTGLCLLKTPFRCLRPFSLSDRPPPVQGAEFDFAVRFMASGYNRFPHGSVQVSEINVKSTRDDIKDVPHLFELVVWSDAQGPRAASTPERPAFWLQRSPFTTWDVPGMIFIDPQQRTVAAVVRAIRKPESSEYRGGQMPFSGTCLAIPGRDVLEICNRLLTEAQLPPLPKREPAVPVAMIQRLPAVSVKLDIEYDNGDQDHAIGLSVGNNEIVVPTEAILRARLITTRQLGLDRPLSRFGSDELSGLTVLRRDKWPQAIPRVCMTLKAPAFEIGEELATIPATDIESPAGLKVKLPWTNLTLTSNSRKCSNAIGIDRNLERGTPLFDAAGHFVALVISDRQPDKRGGLAISADDVWMGLARFRHSIGSKVLNDDEMVLRQAGKPVRRIYRLLPAELALNSQRLQPLFPELKFSIDEQDSSLIVELDSRVGDNVLSEMEQIRKQLTIAPDRPAPEPETASSDNTEAPTKVANAPAFDQAVELAKWYTNKQVVDLQVQFEGIEESIPMEGFFISNDGLLLTVITKKQPVKTIVITRYVMNGEAYQEANVGIEVLARDAATGLALIKTPLKCQQPLNLAPKFDVKQNYSLVPGKTWLNPAGTGNVGSYFHELSIAQKVAVDDVLLDSAVTGRYDEGQPEKLLQFGMNGLVFMRGNLVHAIGYDNSKGNVKPVALPSDAARLICNRMLGEAKLPLLPNPDEHPPFAEEVPVSDDGRGAVVHLQVKLRNGNRRIVKGVVLDESGHVATTYSPRSRSDQVRCRQLGILLDAPFKKGWSDSVAILKLAGPVEYRFVDIDLESPKLTVGDPVFDQTVGIGGLPAPCAKLTRQDATLETFDLTQTHLLTCDQVLPAGTPLFNQTGRFVGLCLDTPNVFTNTTFILPADRVWRQAAQELSGGRSSNGYRDKQTVQTYRFGTPPVETAGRPPQNSPDSIWRNAISPELLSRIYHRLQEAFPELQFALGKEDQSLIIVLEPQQDTRLLAETEYWIQRLVQSSETVNVEGQAEDAVPIPAGYYSCLVKKSDWLEVQTGYPKLVSSLKVHEDHGTVLTILVPKEGIDSPQYNQMLRFLKIVDDTPKSSVGQSPPAKPQTRLDNTGTDVRELVSRYLSTPTEKRDAVQKELLELTTRQFDQRHQQRLNELKTLEGRLISLRAELQKRQELRDEIIRKRVADLLSEENLLKWETEIEPATAEPRRPVKP